MDGLLTVKQGCELLDVSERKLRRVLKEPEIEARLQFQERHGRGKYRQVLLIPPDVVKDLKTRFSDGEKLSEQSKANTGIIQADTGISAASIASIYEQRLADKDLLLLEKDKRIAELTSRAEFAEQTAARAQMLLSMSPPVHQEQEPFWRRWFKSRRKDDET